MSEELEISCQMTHELLGGENLPVLIDCREQDEYDFCRIEGAVLIPLSDPDGRARSEALLRDADQDVIIYCHHGVRSLHAVQYLRELGHENVLSMRGGIDVWSVEVDSSVARY